MGLSQALRPTNRRVRLLVGLLLAGLFAIQCTRTEAFKESAGVVAINGQVLGKTSPAGLARIERMAKSDHIAFLEYCLTNCRESYRDYTCTMVKQEIINGQTHAQQEVQVKFMSQPFSVYMNWIKNPPAGDRVLYVEGRYGNKMLARPSVRWQRLIIPTVIKSPDDAEALRNTLRPVNMFGFERNLQSLLEVYRLASRRHELEEAFGGYANVGDRPAIVLIRHLPERAEYPGASAKTVTFIDTDYLVPIRIEGYDASDKPTSMYEFSRIKFNVGLTADDFVPEKYGLTTPK